MRLYRSLSLIGPIFLRPKHTIAIQPNTQISYKSKRNMSRLAPYAAQHASPSGAGDARPTALQIVKDQDLVGKLAGKVMLVTGCSSGIGVETARALHATGADVYVTVRNVPRGKEVVEDIKTDGAPGKVEMIEMELDSLGSIRKGAQDFLSKSKTLNVLVNNAGIMACPEDSTKDGFELQWGTNHLGHFLLFQLLKPTLLASATPEFNSRVVSVSSTGHRRAEDSTKGDGPLDLDDLDFKKRGYEPWLSYGQAKVSNIYFANELDRRYGSKGIHALSLHPGGIWTPLGKHQKGMAKLKGDPKIEWYMKSTEQGAATTVWAALAKEWEGKGGKYLEDCEEAGPADMSPEGVANPLRKGYAPWAYHVDKEKKLWVESLKLAGVSEGA